MTKRSNVQEDEVQSALRVVEKATNEALARMTIGTPLRGGYLEPGYGVIVGGKIVIFTQVDHAKQEGTFKFFSSRQELEDWVSSLAKPGSPS